MFADGIMNLNLKLTGSINERQLAKRLRFWKPRSLNMEISLYLQRCVAACKLSPTERLYMGDFILHFEIVDRLLSGDICTRNGKAIVAAASFDRHRLVHEIGHALFFHFYGPGPVWMSEAWAMFLDKEVNG